MKPLCALAIAFSLALIMSLRAMEDSPRAPVPSTRAPRILPPSAEEARTALVIGCDYNGSQLQLPSPLRDAQALKAKLREVGFAANDVTLLLNPTRKRMLDAIESLGTALATRGGIGLFYFSGHGAQHDGENYLLPAQSEISFREDLQSEAVAAQRVVTRMEAAGNRVNLLFLDACRNNPLPSSRQKAAFAKGLGGMNAASGMLIGFATARNTVANDSGEGSLYTNALLRQISTPGLSVTDLLTRVNAEVRKTSGGTQIPFMEVGLSDVFAFVPGNSPGPLPPSPTPSPAGDQATVADPGQAKQAMKSQNSNESGTVTSAGLAGLARTSRSFSRGVPGVIYDYAPSGMDEEEFRQALTEKGSYHASITSLPATRAQADRIKSVLEARGIVLTVEELPDRPPAYLASAPRVLYYGKNSGAEAKELAEAFSKATGLHFSADEGATPPAGGSRRFAIHCVSGR